MSEIKADSLATRDGTSRTDMANAIFGSAKAHVNFNGTGTVAIRNSYNVSSITDNGVGDYTVNFASALADANYATTGLKHDTTSVLDGHINISLQVNTSVSMQCIENSVSTDSDLVTVAIFR